MSLADPSPTSDALLRLDSYLPYRLSVAANAVSELIARAYQSRFGLTIPQWRVIAVLGEEGPLIPQAICTRTVMDKVTISRAAAALVERGLLARALHEADGRSHHLTLTVAGRDLYAEVVPLALDYEAALLAAFSGPEQQALHELLRRIETVAASLAPDWEVVGPAGLEPATRPL
jgi:DNA-binding MarR family transcriptional regulator